MGGNEYLLVADQYSRSPLIRCPHSTTSAAIIKQIKLLFEEQGIPEGFYSGNGSQYTRNFPVFQKMSRNIQVSNLLVFQRISISSIQHHHHIIQMVSQRWWLEYAKRYFWNPRKLALTVTWQWCHTEQCHFQPFSNPQLNYSIEGPFWTSLVSKQWFGDKLTWDTMQ